jgi:cellulose synthase/poly-beta-1,6-N-acetylglucosamine synthase-like glycosyltransferase
MTARGLVSVVMAAFDEEAFIGDAIASVLAQTYTPIEVIVVDDAPPTAPPTSPSNTRSPCSGNPTMVPLPPVTQG